MTGEFIKKISELANANSELRTALQLAQGNNPASLTPPESAALLGAIREYGDNCAKRARLKGTGRDLVEFWVQQEALATMVEAKLFPKVR